MKKKELPVWTSTIINGVQFRVFGKKILPLAFVVSDKDGYKLVEIGKPNDFSKEDIDIWINT